MNLSRLGIGLFALVAVVGVSVYGFNNNAGAESPDEDEIATLFNTWNQALATGTPETVADLYAPNGVLLPTVSNQVRTNRAEIVDYFTQFLKAKPSGVIEKQIIHVLSDDHAINTGVYRFSLTKDGQETSVRARYTYVYEKVDGDWLIINHHSSAMPEPE